MGQSVPGFDHSPCDAFFIGFHFLLFVSVAARSFAAQLQLESGSIQPPIPHGNGPIFLVLVQLYWKSIELPWAKTKRQIYLFLLWKFWNCLLLCIIILQCPPVIPNSLFFMHGSQHCLSWCREKELFNTSYPSIYSWYLTGILPWKQGKFEIKANTLVFLIFQ